MKVNVNKEMSQDELRNQIGNIVIKMGYNRCGEEIINNRKPRRNATFFIQSFCNKINLTDEEYKFKNAFDYAITLLKPNSQNKLNFIDTMNDYSNAIAEYWKISHRIDSLQLTDETRSQWMELKEETDKAFNETMRLEYLLCDFVD